MADRCAFTEGRPLLDMLRQLEVAVADWAQTRDRPTWAVDVVTAEAVERIRRAALIGSAAGEVEA